MASGLPTRVCFNHTVIIVCHFRVLSVCLFVCLCLFVAPHCFEFSIAIFRRLLARSTSATTFMYFENGTIKTRVEVRHFVRTVALRAMYDTVHRALINRYTHTDLFTSLSAIASSPWPWCCVLLPVLLL